MREGEGRASVRELGYMRKGVEKDIRGEREGVALGGRGTAEVEGR